MHEFPISSIDKPNFSIITTQSKINRCSWTMLQASDSFALLVKPKSNLELIGNI